MLTCLTSILYKSLFTEKRQQHKKHSNTNININKTKSTTESVVSKRHFVLEYEHNRFYSHTPNLGNITACSRGKQRFLWEFPAAVDNLECCIGYKLWQVIIEMILKKTRAMRLLQLLLLLREWRAMTPLWFYASRSAMHDNYHLLFARARVIGLRARSGIIVCAFTVRLGPACRRTNPIGPRRQGAAHKRDICGSNSRPRCRHFNCAASLALQGRIRVMFSGDRQVAADSIWNLFSLPLKVMKLSDRPARAEQQTLWNPRHAAIYRHYCKKNLTV